MKMWLSKECFSLLLDLLTHQNRLGHFKTNFQTSSTCVTDTPMADEEVIASKDHGALSIDVLQLETVAKLMD